MTQKRISATVALGYSARRAWMDMDTFCSSIAQLAFMRSGQNIEMTFSLDIMLTNRSNRRTDMPTNGQPKEHYSMRARIDSTDNGATMVIRRHATWDSPGTVILNKVYTDFDSLVKDLKETMKFRFSK